MMDMTCKACLYHLPTWAGNICQCDESPLFGTFTGEDDSCITFERWEPHEQESGTETAGTD